MLSEFEERGLYQVVLTDARAEGDEYLLYPHEAGGLSDPLFVSGEFRGLRSATKDSVLGTCDLSRKVDQSFSADDVGCGFILSEELHR